MRQPVKTSAAILSFTLAAAVVAFAQAPQDQDHSGPPHHPQGDWHHHEPSPEFETKMLSKRLGLTPEQAAAITPIFAEREERMKALRPAEGTQPDFKAMHEQRKAIMEDIEQKVDAVLTPEQKAQMDAMHQHRGGPGGPHGDWGQKQPAPPAA